MSLLNDLPLLANRFRLEPSDHPLFYEALLERKFEVLAACVVLILAGKYLLQTIYNILFHPLSRVPGPWLAKVNASYLVPAQAGLHRAQTLRGLHDKYGAVVRIGPNEVSVSDWTAYRQIYSHHGSNKTHHFYEDTILAGPGSTGSLFTFNDKKAHGARRKLQSAAYSMQAVLQNESLIAQRADVLLRRMVMGPSSNVSLGSGGLSEGGSSKKVTADVFLLNGLFSLEVILKCVYNRQYGDAVAGDSLTLLRAMDSSQIAVTVRAALPIVTRSLGRRIPGTVGRSFRAWDLWESMTATLIEQFEQNELAGDRDRLRFMITPMFLHEDTFMGRRLNRVDLIEEMMGLTAAGSGTTSTTLTYLMYSMAREPAMQDRLREELRTVGETFNDIKDLAFLNAVIKETMRVYPTIISTLPRILDKPLAVGKHLLPEGTFVGMQNYVHHRDPLLYPHPDEFWPDRWLADAGAESGSIRDMNSALTPFSLGPRSCIGQNLARVELYLATSKVFRNYRLSVNSDMTQWDMEMEDRFNVAPKGRRCLLDVEVVN